YAGLGLREQSLARAERAAEWMPVSRDAYEGPLVRQALAQVCLRNGEKERTLDLLEELLRVPGYLSYGYLLHDPAWEAVRSEPRFQQLLASLAPHDGE
ncbi:MAG TPA: hypothetical protein VF551_02190, partial [Chthoniobacterales bacterium]